MLKGLDATYFAVNKNFQELSVAIVNFENNFEIMGYSRREEFELFFKELLRLFHNYLASIFSLIRHTSNLCKDLDCSNIEKEYTKKVEDLNSADCVFFIKDLRNFIQHVGLPALSGQFKLENTQNGQVVKQKILFEKEDLLKWKNWSAASKRYISNNQEINLKIAINQYQALVNQFHKWFIQRVILQYSEEFEEFARIDKEIGELNSCVMNAQRNKTAQH